MDADSVRVISLAIETRRTEGAGPNALSAQWIAVSRGGVDVDVAVGSDILLAHADGPGQEPSRWFMADAPGG